jgi:hypothetical protein
VEALAREAMAVEHARRAEWREVVERAAGRQVFAEIETRPLIYMSGGSLTIVHQD